MKQTFAFTIGRTGKPFKGLSARAVVAEFLEIEKRNGTLTPEAIVAAATPTRSRLHKCFVWDDSEAGHRYRLLQAQGLLRRVVVTMAGPTGTTQIVRALVHIPGEHGVYQPIARVLGNEANRFRLLQAALTELAAFQKKYAALEELSGVISAIDAALDSTKELLAEQSA